MSDAAPKVPQHVAIIMDGNGRWAKQRGLPRIKGHQEGAESVRAVLRACRVAGVKYLTLYAFSSENWVRPKAEVRGLMMLLIRFLRKQAHELHDNQVQLRVSGHVDDLPADVRKELDRVIAETRDYQKGVLTLAEKVKKGALAVADIDEAAISSHLYQPDIPDPDLMIRTSGEQRISNFLLWQLSYAEFYFTSVYWPDFREAQFHAAIEEYARRHRRFGDIQ